MKIIKAKTAGFCFGVDRAVKLTYGLLEQGVRVATLGPLIHNPQCVGGPCGPGRRYRGYTRTGARRLRGGGAQPRRAAVRVRCAWGPGPCGA